VTRPVDPRLLRQSRSSRPFLLVCVLLGLASAACVLGQAVLLATMITAVFLHGAGLDAVGGGLGLLAGFVAARAVLAYAQETAAARVSAAVASQLRTACCAVDLGPTWLHQRRGGELTQLATRGRPSLLRPISPAADAHRDRASGGLDRHLGHGGYPG